METAVHKEPHFLPFGWISPSNFVIRRRPKNQLGEKGSGPMHTLRRLWGRELFVSSFLKAPDFILNLFHNSPPWTSYKMHRKIVKSSNFLRIFPKSRTLIPRPPTRPSQNSPQQRSPLPLTPTEQRRGRFAVSYRNTVVSLVSRCFFLSPNGSNIRNVRINRIRRPSFRVSSTGSSCEPNQLLQTGRWITLQVSR